MTTYTIEGFDRSGQVFLHLRDTTLDDVITVLRGALEDPKTGGVVIYRPVTKEGGESDGQRLEQLGLVAGKPVAGGNGRLTYCRYCQTTGGHTADCTVIS